MFFETAYSNNLGMTVRLPRGGEMPYGDDMVAPIMPGVPAIQLPGGKKGKVKIIVNPPAPAGAAAPAPAATGAAPAAPPPAADDSGDSLLAGMPEWLPIAGAALLLLFLMKK